jgi:hypothetical protein
MPVIVCKNCDHHFKGKYCPECGQSAKVEPIGIKYFIHDIPHSILHIDKGFFYTLWHLLVRPAKTLRDYLAGKRVRHFRPFAFVLIMATACTLLGKGCFYLINLRRLERGEQGFEFGYGKFFAQYPALLIFMLIPLLSLVTWLFFRKRQYNYWEHFLINTYLAAYLNVFLLLISVARLVKYYASGVSGVNFTSFMFLFMTYYGFAFGPLMRQKTKLGQHILVMCLMNVLLAMLYVTAFSLTGIMSPWWGK